MPTIHEASVPVLDAVVTKAITGRTRGDYKKLQLYF